MSSAKNQNPDTQPLPASGLAVAALVLGICSIPTCFCYGVPSVICAVVGLVLAYSASQQVAAGTAGGQGFIKAGRICSIIGLVLSVLYWILLAVFFIFFASRMKDTIKHAQEQQARQAQHDAQQNPPPAPAPSQP